MSVKTNASEDRYTFFVDWFDSAAELTRQYQLTYFLRDNTVEMYDIKNKRAFLKRCEIPSVSISDLYVGSHITVYSRLLKVTNYADDYTRLSLSETEQRTLALIKPGAYSCMGKIMAEILQTDGLFIANLRMCKLSADEVKTLYSQALQSGDCEYMASDVIVALELHGANCVEKWQELMRSLNEKLASDGIRNAVHGSNTRESAERELGLFFGHEVIGAPTALFNNCTCLIIKPHATRTPALGRILQRVLDEDFEISALQMFHLNKVSAEEFMEVYKGILPELSSLVLELSSGPCVVAEIRQSHAVSALRKLCGPHDPQIAAHLRKDTIRAEFGVDKVKNAVHCTDLEEDGLLEIEYFFRILNSESNCINCIKG